MNKIKNTEKIFLFPHFREKTSGGKMKNFALGEKMNLVENIHL